MPEHRILLEFHKGKAAVATIRDTLPSARAGEGDEEGSSTEARRIVYVHKAASRIRHVINRPLVKCHRLMLPVYQIMGRGMSPVHVSPPRPERVELIIKMVPTVMPDQSVRVVVPSPQRAEMELIPIRFVQSNQNGIWWRSGPDTRQSLPDTPTIGTGIFDLKGKALLQKGEGLKGIRRPPKWLVTLRKDNGEGLPENGPIVDANQALLSPLIPWPVGHRHQQAVLSRLENADPIQR
jgi:hypothetical protein